MNKRAQRDVELRQDDIARTSHEQIMARMEKKSKVYDQMKRGDYSGISDAQLAELPFEVCIFAIWRLKSSDRKYSPMRD